MFSAKWRQLNIVLKAKKMSPYNKWENIFPGMNVTSEILVILVYFIEVTKFYLKVSNIESS